MSFWSNLYRWFTHTPKPVVVPPKPPVVTPPPVVSPPPVVTPPSTPPPSGANVVFNAPFNDANNWVVGHTSAFPGYNSTPQTNPGDHKLDRISPSFGPSVSGLFLATRSNVSGLWDTDLVTTEGSKNGFKLQPGDVLTADVTVSPGNGAWPSIWSWSGPNGEVDAFEYHPDNPNLLELSNHTGGNVGNYYKYADGLVTPGKTFKLKVSFLTSGVQWSVDGKPVFTSTGVPANWSAYLIVNISVSDGTYHPAPDPATSQLNFTVENLQVIR